jgi:hypothetical protein
MGAVPEFANSMMAVVTDRFVPVSEFQGGQAWIRQVGHCGYGYRLHGQRL